MMPGICDVTSENMTIDATIGKKSISFLRLFTEFQMISLTLFLPSKE